MPAPKVEQDCGEPVKILEDRLILDQGVGHHEFHIVARASRHLWFQAPDHPALPVPAFLNGRGTVFVRPELGDAGIGEHGNTEKWS